MAAALSLAFSAQAQQPAPLEIKNVRIGAPGFSVHDQFPWARCTDTSCFISPDADDRRACPPPVDRDCYRDFLKRVFFGPGKAKSFSYSIRDGVIESAYVRFPNDVWTIVVKGLVEKYGPPTKDTTETIQNRMGAKFESQSLEWARPDGRLVATQRAADIDTASVIMDSTAAMARAAAKAKDPATAKAAAGLL